MKLDEGLKLRLQFLSRVVKKEADYLQDTDARLFAKALDVSDLQRTAQDALLAERLAGHAFVSTLVKTADQFVAQADSRIAASLS